MQGRMNFDKKKMMKFLPLFLLVVIVCICVGVGVALVKPEKEEKVDVGISGELKKDKQFLDLTLKDIDIEEGEDITHLMANVYNHGETFKDQMVNIVFLDKSGKELGKAPTYISEIEKDGALRIDTVIDKKYAKAYTFKIEG